jgi:transcriptional regulator with XRE-family HTH domain
MTTYNEATYTTMATNTLGEWLEREIERRGWDTYFKASVGLDLPIQTIHDIIKGKNKNPAVKTLRKIADGFNVSLEYLFDLMGHPKARPGIPEDGRALPESVKGLSAESFQFLSQMTPDELERWLELMEQTRRPGGTS